MIKKKDPRQEINVYFSFLVLILQLGWPQTSSTLDVCKRACSSEIALVLFIFRSHRYKIEGHNCYYLLTKH